MKRLSLLLVASVIANVCLLVVHFRSDDAAGKFGAAGGFGGIGGGGTNVGPGVERGAGGVAGTGASGAIAGALQSGDVEVLRDELRAAGVDEDIVRGIVAMRLWKRYETRMKALQTVPDAHEEWWKNPVNGWSGQSKEQRAAMKAIQAEMKAENERVLGKDPNGPGNNPWLERQYGFLPTEKREALMQLE
jgi:hypothetical protein